MAIVVTATKTFTDVDGEETMYQYTATGYNLSEATHYATMYASMVEYGMKAEKYAPAEMAFPREQLYQFIQRGQLDIIESMYPDAVSTAYSNAMAYVQSYIGAMFDVDTIIANNDTTSTGLTLRLALCICTVTYILASSPQYAETIEMHNKQLHTLLKGLKSGSRNFGKNAVIGEPDVRCTVIKLQKTGSKI